MSTSRESPKKKYSGAVKAQRDRFLRALILARADGVTVIQAREDLDIMMPSSRVHELRWSFGFNIVMEWTHCVNAQGSNHRCGRYILLNGQWQRGAP